MEPIHSMKRRRVTCLKASLPSPRDLPCSYCPESSTKSVVDLAVIMRSPPSLRFRVLLRVESPTRRSIIRFAVKGVPGSQRSARLQELQSLVDHARWLPSLRACHQ